MKKVIAAIAKFLGLIPKKIKIAASRSLEITNRIKKALEHPVSDIITMIIPGDWDDNLKKVILQYLNQAIPYLKVVDNCKEKDGEDMIICWIDELKKMPKETQDALLIKLASLLTAYQDGKKLKQSLYDYFTQHIYTANK